MKHLLSSAALSVILACTISLPAEARSSGPSATLGKPPTYTGMGYHECLGIGLYSHLEHGLFKSKGLFKGLNDIINFCQGGHVD